MRSLLLGYLPPYLVRPEHIAVLAMAAFVAGCATGVGSRPHGIEYHAPSISPDGQQIMVGAFDYNDGQQYLELMRADGRGLTRIAPIPFAKHPGEWSADGKLLAFVAYSHHRTELSLMGTDDRKVVPISSSRSLQGRSARWVPNSREISYSLCTRVSFKACDAGDLMAVGVEGGEPRVLVADAGPWDGMWTLWSPDGHWIAYQHFSESLNCSPPICSAAPIFVRSAQNGEERRLPRGIPITWTPDSRYLLFLGSRLERVAVGGGEAEPFFEGDVVMPITDQRKLWDRSGQRLALAMREGIVILNRTGRLIADFREQCPPFPRGCSEYEGSLAWTPDGNGIVYARREFFHGEGRREGGIYMLNIQTGKSTLLLADTMEW